MKEEIRIKDNWANREIREDELLNENTLKLIQEIHGQIVKVEKHFKVGGMEVDAIIHCRKSRTKRVGVELKESDINKALEQAIKRRNYFNYFYIILGSDRRLIGYDIRSLRFKLDDFFRNSIGIITIHNSEAFLIYPSYHKSVGLENVRNFK